MRSMLLVIMIMPALVACGGGGEPDLALAAMNRGVAHLEQFDYPLAVTAFEEALKGRPDWIAAKLNLSIALLNTQGQPEHDRARALCREVLASEPLNPHANYLLGFLTRLDTRSEEAIAFFDKVLEADPADPGALFWKGRCLAELGRHEEANAVFERAIGVAPYLVAAYHARHSRLMLMGRRDEAEASRVTAARLRAPPGKAFPIHGDLLTAQAYHELGRYALAIRDYEGAEPEPDRSAEIACRTPAPGPLANYRYGGGEGAEFTDPGGADYGDDPHFEARIGPGVAVGDFDGDGDTDAFIPEWGGTGRLYRNDGGLSFSDATEAAGIKTSCRGISAIFFDADGDGDPDLYIAAAGPNVFYENQGDGTFLDKTEATGLAGPEDAVSLTALPGDFDHEGDIDLFVANCGSGDLGLTGYPDNLFQNSRDGTFKDVAKESGIDGGRRRSIGALAIDIDRDQDTDLLVLRDRAPAALWLNERIWNFRAGELPEELSSREPCWGAAAGDLDRDGREEVVILRGPAADAEFYRTGAKGILRRDFSWPRGIRWRTTAVLDADLDGRLDLIGDAVLVQDGQGGFHAAAETCAAPANSRGIGFADFDGDGDIDRLVATHGGALILETIAPQGNHWVAFELQGREALQPAAWSARVGPGPELEIRAGGLWQPLRARAASGFLSTIETPVRFGLGPHTVVDLVRIVWPDRVLQVEAEIPADQVKRIVELNRKPASCPMLFAWDGERFRFVSDFLGVGGLGFFLGPGVYGQPDPDEVVRIGRWPTPEDGKVVLQVLEPLEEISYVDEATLIVADHPEGMEVYPNEAYVGEPARFPEFRIYGVDAPVFPRRATDIAGRDVLATILETDRVYAPVVPDLRFPGVAKEHVLTLDFEGRVPEVADGERLVLFIDGWIEYGYSNTFFGAWQAGIEGAPPCLEVPDAKGGWETRIPNVGCPAGLPKGMTVDLTGIVTAGSPTFRIRTNFEVYWDRVFLARDAGAGAVRLTRLKPTSADLHDRGYPREFSPDGKMPLVYDYSIMDPGFPFKRFIGDYTRFGEVSPLLERADDRYVIMAHGEELTLTFDVGSLPLPEEGWARTYLLHSAGWCKDMDPYTAFPDTVGPLPFRGMSGYPYGDGESYPGGQEWQREWNTRKVLPRK